jgi:hypothetical protein
MSERVQPPPRLVSRQEKAIDTRLVLEFVKTPLR